MLLRKPLRESNSTISCRRPPCGAHQHGKAHMKAIRAHGDTQAQERGTVLTT